MIFSVYKLRFKEFTGSIDLSDETNNENTQSNWNGLTLNLYLKQTCKFVFVFFK